jgi:NitT/TauT family transport system ATP-binding protein
MPEEISIATHQNAASVAQCAPEVAALHKSNTLNSMNTLVRFHHVQKQFANGTQALQDFDLHLQVGQFTSLLGPSGCGKSTALRLIAGLDEPSAGTIEKTLSVQDLSFVFQESTLMPWAKVWENVSLPLRVRYTSPEETKIRVDAALKKVGLQDFASAYPRQLSGGMKMRVSIARALVTQPKVLLMDEPFAALDEITRGKLNADLLALRAQDNLSIVFVTHSVYESVFLSDRIVVMSDRPGRIIGDLATPSGQVRDELFRTSPRYAEWCRDISAILKLNA